MSSSESEDGEMSESEEDTQVAPRPLPIKHDDDISDFVIHPSQDGRIAVADMNGYLNMYKFDVEQEAVSVMRKRLSKQPLRCLCYNQGGDGIFVAGKKGSLRLFDIEQERCSLVLMSSDSPSYSICVVDKNLVASGDDDGTLKVWDVRKGKVPIMEEDRSHDFISCLAVDSRGKFLFATSGDGTMSTFNIKRRKFVVQSENAEHDMNCVSVVKDDKKVVVGTSEGIMLFFNWEEFAAPSDRFPGHRSSVECIVPISQDIVCTGSLDGSIRAVHTLPNRYLGIVGEHRGMSVGKIDVTVDRKYIASSSHDSVVKFWSVEHLHSTKIDANAKPRKGLKTKKIVKSGVSGDKVSFLSDLEKEVDVPVVETSEEEDGDEDEEDGEAQEEQERE